MAIIVEGWYSPDHMDRRWEMLCLGLGKAASIAFERQGVGSEFKV